jgi:hypothetical protein
MDATEERTYRTNSMSKRKKLEKFDQKKEVRAIARERVGAVPGSRVIAEKAQRKKPKYKNDPENTDDLAL